MPGITEDAINTPKALTAHRRNNCITEFDLMSDNYQTSSYPDSLFLPA